MSAQAPLLVRIRPRWLQLRNQQALRLPGRSVGHISILSQTFNHIESTIRAPGSNVGFVAPTFGVALAGPGRLAAPRPAPDRPLARHYHCRASNEHHDPNRPVASGSSDRLRVRHGRSDCREAAARIGPIPGSIPGIGPPPAPTGRKLVTGAQKLIVEKHSGAVPGRLREWARNIFYGTTDRS